MAEKPVRKRAAKKTVAPEPENELGLVFLDGEPPVPQSNRVDREFWINTKTVLIFHTGKWALVKTYPLSKNGAAAKSSDINRGAVTLFPNKEFEARHKKTEDGLGSVLYMRHKPL